MKKYSTFTFASYDFIPATKTATFSYRFDDSLSLSEKYIFDFDFATYDPEALDRALQLLFFLAGVSYYKMYLPEQISVTTGKIDEKLAAFLSNTYQKGLGEFFYTNQLDPSTSISFPTSNSLPQQTPVHSSGLLIAVGGGKDSLVSIELLRSSGLDLATWSVGHREQLSPLVERIGLPHFHVDRQIDTLIQELNASDAYNGHIPISAIFAAVGCIVAILTGRRDIVMSNEQSANEPTLHYKDHAINHQYSKSQEFEASFQKILLERFGDSIRYYSLLRPYSELKIAKLFSASGFETYKDVFSSCNRAFRQGESKLYWCGKCSKCAFVFLALTPFVPRKELETLFSGSNLLLDTGLGMTYRQLLGLEDNKPLDCIGTIDESRVAMRLAQKVYPELSIYEYAIDSTFDYMSNHPDLIPGDIKHIMDMIVV